MISIFVTIRIKEGYADQFTEASFGDAQGSTRDEPECYRFDILQDDGDPNRIHLYEVYKDEDAFHAHTQAPHFIKWRDASADWREDSGLQGAGRGATNIWPSDDEWK